MVDRQQQHRGVVVRTFASEDATVEAVNALTASGFPADDIMVVTRETGSGDAVAEGAGVGALTGTALGALGGLLIGASALVLPGVGLVIAGPIAAAIFGAGAGALAGGLGGALLGLGLPEEEARAYVDRVQAGEVLVAVVAGEREAEARRILDDAADRAAEDGTASPRPTG